MARTHFKALQAQVTVRAIGIDEGMDRLAEESSLTNAGPVSQAFQESCGFGAGYFEAAGAWRRHARHLLELGGSADREQVANIDVSHPGTAFGLVHVMRSHK